MNMQSAELARTANKWNIQAVEAMMPAMSETLPYQRSQAELDRDVVLMEARQRSATVGA